MQLALAEGLRLFNDQRFFEAHEALETLWLSAQNDEKLFLHGLVQVAAAFHHYQRGNVKGFRRVLTKGANKLAQFPEAIYGIDLLDLRRQIKTWLEVTPRAEALGSTNALSLPQIRMARDLSSP